MTKFLDHFRRKLSRKMSGKEDQKYDYVAASYFTDIPRSSELLEDGQRGTDNLFNASDFDVISETSYYLGCLRIIDLVRVASESGRSEESVADVLADAYREVCEKLATDAERLDRKRYRTDR